MAHASAHPFPVVDTDAHPPLSACPIEHTGELDEALFFSRLTRAGIDIACGRLLPPPGFFETHEPAEAIGLLNSAAFALSQREPRYLPALWIHPACPDFSVSQLAKYAPLGVRMIGADGGRSDHPAFLHILSHAQEFGMTVALHGESISQIDALAARFPGLRLLIGGLGSTGYMPARAFELMKQHKNLLLNLSGVIWGCNYALHEWCSRLGPDRLFFGSGYPFSNPAGRLAALRWELRDQPASVHEKIFSQNALRLTGAEGRTA